MARRLILAAAVAAILVPDTGARAGEPGQGATAVNRIGTLSTGAERDACAVEEAGDAVSIAVGDEVAVSVVTDRTAGCGPVAEGDGEPEPGSTDADGAGSGDEAPPRVRIAIPGLLCLELGGGTRLSLGSGGCDAE